MRFKFKLSLLSAFILLALTLALIGLLFVFEASVAESFAAFGEPYHFVRLQSLRLLIGLAAFFVLSFLPHNLWRKLSPLLFFGGLALLLAIFIPGLGQAHNGARRWLQLGPVFFQPVELFKLGLVSFYAHWLTKHQRLAPFLFLTGLISFLLLLQPDLGSLLVILSISFSMFFLSGAKIWHFLTLTLAAIIILGLLIISSPYRWQRVMTFVNPELDPLGSSFHIRQITLALGSGSWLGQGIGKSRQRFSYVPEASTDSIFAIIAEEVGFLGSLGVISLFALYFYLGFKLINRQKNQYSYLLECGLLIWIASQTLLNLAAVVALVPLTGLPLPFFSYGGTSLIMILAANGIIVAGNKT